MLHSYWLSWECSCKSCVVAMGEMSPALNFLHINPQWPCKGEPRDSSSDCLSARRLWESLSSSPPPSHSLADLGFPDVLLCAHRGYKNTASSSGRTDLFEEPGTPQSIPQFTWKSCSIERENERVKKPRRESKWEVTPVRSSTWLVF